jgi:hypothetical protein
MRGRQFQIVKRSALVLAAAIGIGAGTCQPNGASAADVEDIPNATTRELLDRIKSLEAEVQQLKQAQAATAPTGIASDNAAAVAVQRDADRRSESLGELSPFTAGYAPERGFILQSEDGRFLLHPWAYFQFRNVTTYREQSSATVGADTQNGFEIRRAKLIFDGNVFSKDLTYQFIWGTDRKSGNLQLEDAWARYHFPDTPYAVRAGQIRNPFDHEQIVFGTRLLTVDRSLVDDLFAAGEGIVQGVSLGYEQGPIRAEVAFTDGLRSQDTNFQDFPTNSADFGFSGRVEYKASGLWDAYTDFTALYAKEPLLVFGLGMDYTQAGDTGQFTHVVDVQYKLPNSLAIYAAYLGRYVQNNSGLPGTNGGAVGGGETFDTYEPTLRLQAAYALDTHWEPYVRYEYIYFDPATLPSTVNHDAVHEVTAGFNYYFYRHRAKISADVIYLPNGCPVSDDGTGVLATDGGDEIVFRAQFQLVL